MTKSSTFAIVDLHPNPKENAAAFMSSANTFASLLGTSLHPQGLFGLGVFMTLEQYRRRNPPRANAEGNMVAQDKPTFDEYPRRVGGAASNN